MAKKEKRPRLAIVEKDAWLLPVEEDVNARFERYKSKLAYIENEFGSLYDFASAHHYLGITYDADKKGWWYREWAPAAFGLFLFGDFNNWNRISHPLTKDDKGIWTLFLPDAEYKDTFIHGSKIKVLIEGHNGWNERIPAFMTRVVQDQDTPNFSAQLWMPAKPFDWEGDKFDMSNIANQILIYESHVGMAQEKQAVGTYMEYAEHILPRIKAAGYNAVQLMAVSEHPYYGSFGYHVSNFFAPSSRCGTPEELKYLIKKAHSMGMAVIMDIVHSHTVKNFNEGLNEFDGSRDHYFHSGSRGHHPDWDSKLFDYGKTEVIQFLLSNVRYWMEEFHFDGFRFDGVTSMLYWHHGSTSFDHQNKFFKDGVEYDAVVYLQLANKLIHHINPHAVSLAEDVSGMPGLTDKQEEGGIGFDYRLGMGLPDFWIKLLKEAKDEYWNVEHMFNEMTNRKWDVKTIAYAESHDQALVGDKTIAFRLMDKDMYWFMRKSDQSAAVDRGIALHKMIRLFTVSLGGDGYMNFMGNEFGHPEWIDFPREGNGYSYWYARRQWSLYDNKELRYHYLGDFDRAMIEMVKKHNVLQSSFPEKLKVDDWHKTIAYKRGKLIFVYNWHVDQSPFDYEIYVPEAGKYKIILNSDSPEFGGFNRVNNSLEYFTVERDGANFLKIYLPNRSTLVFEKVD